MHYLLAFLTITHGVLGCLGLISIARSQTNESLSELMNDLAADMTQLMSINRALLIAQWPIWDEEHEDVMSSAMSWRYFQCNNDLAVRLPFSTPGQTGHAWQPLSKWRQDWIVESNQQHWIHGFPQHASSDRIHEQLIWIDSWTVSRALVQSALSLNR